MLEKKFFFKKRSKQNWILSFTRISRFSLSKWKIYFLTQEIRMLLHRKIAPLMKLPNSEEGS